MNGSNTKTMTWRRSTKCASGSCLEVALGSEILIRDSKLGEESPIIPVSRAAFQRFIDAVKNGEIGSGA